MEELNEGNFFKLLANAFTINAKGVILILSPEIESVKFISKTMKSIVKCALMNAPHMLCLDGSEEAKSPYYLHVQHSDF